MTDIPSHEAIIRWAVPMVEAGERSRRRWAALEELVKEIAMAQRRKVAEPLSQPAAPAAVPIAPAAPPSAPAASKAPQSQEAPSAPIPGLLVRPAPVPSAVPAPLTPPPRPRPSKYVARRVKDGKVVGEIGDYALQPTADALRPHGPGEFQIAAYSLGGVEIGERTKAIVHDDGRVEFVR